MLFAFSDFQKGKLIDYLNRRVLRDQLGHLLVGLNVINMVLIAAWTTRCGGFLPLLRLRNRISGNVRVGVRSR
jgi:hypothetical protein